MPEDRESILKRVSYSRQPDLTVILENVHDSHNISAVLRTCEAVGIPEIFILYTDAQYSISRVKLGKRTSAGARKWVDAHYFRNLGECMQVVRDKYNRILGTLIDSNSKSLFTSDLSESSALVFGNEHMGISEEMQHYLDGIIHIPMVGMVTSLNISVACGIVLYEAYRQREAKGFYNPEYAPFRKERERIHSDYSVRNSLLGDNFHIIYPK